MSAKGGVAAGEERVAGCGRLFKECLCSPWMSPSRSFIPPCMLAACSFQSSCVDVLSSWTDCRSGIGVCSQAAFVYSICNQEDSFCTGRSQAITAKSTGLFLANSETEWRTRELQSAVNGRYHLAGTFKATLAVRDDGQRLG